MSTIITRSGKGAALTNAEVDANFTNLNDDKLESSDLSVVTASASGSGSLTYASTVFTFTPPDLSAYVVDLSSSDTDDLAEGATNLYYTDARARSAISVSGDLSYNSTTGVISFTNDAGDIESVTAGSGLTGGGITGDVTLNVGAGTGITVAADSVSVDMSAFDTDDLSEGATNLYYTDERVDDRVNTLIQAGLGITTSYDDVNNELTIESDTIEELCKNGTASTILKGTPVYQTGTAGNAMVIAPADASSASTMPAVGVLAEDLTASSEGTLLLMGRISGVDTSSFSEGDVIYVASGGGYTNTRPTGESVYVQNLGRVTKVDASNGGGVVMGSGRVNDIPNLGDGKIFIGNGTGAYEQRVPVVADISDLTATAAELNYTDGVTSNIQTQLDSKLASSSYTASDVLTKIKTVDGSGSGLDADTLDGQQGSYYTGYTDTAIANLVDTAPTTLDTLNELAAALGDDPNFATTVTNSIATKMPIAGGTFTGDVSFSTGADFGSAVAPSGATDLSRHLALYSNTYGFSITGGTINVVANGANTLSSTSSLLVSRVNHDFAGGIDVTGNITVTGTVDGRDVAADGSKLDGIESGATADQTASEILTAIKTVDGSGSGLDADTLDGSHASAFATAAQGTLADSALQSSDIGVSVQGYSSILANTTASFTTADETKLDGIESGATADQTASEILTAIKTVDGSGSGLDADTLDGNEATAFATAAQGSLADSALQSSDIGVSVQAYSSVLANTTASFTTADETKLDGIQAGAEVNPDLISQVEAEAGTATTERLWSAERVAQAISALGGGSTGTIASQDADSVSITGGSIDATIIGATTPAAGSFTTFTSTGIDDNATSTQMTITSTNQLGFGTTSPVGKFHILESSAGGGDDPLSTSNQLVVERGANAGISIKVPDTSYSGIYFATPSSRTGGRLRWSYTDKEMILATSVTGSKITFKADSYDTCLTLSGAPGSELAEFVGDVDVGGDVTVTGAISDSAGDVRTMPSAGTKTTSYTLATSDVGKYVDVSTGGSVTIPDATFSQGDVITLVNTTGNEATVTCSITTAYIAGQTTDYASVTLQKRGICTLVFHSGTEVYMSGDVS